MDPLSVTASIIAILQLSSKVIGYLNDVKEASKDRARCAIEATNLHSLLTNLRFRLEEGDVSTPWFTAIRGLNTENGPLDQFKEALQLLQDRMIERKSRFGQAVNVLTWKFRKEEIDPILQTMERLKTLVGIALQMDHFKLSQAINNDTTFIRGLMPTIRAGIESIQQDQNRAQLDALKTWISPIDVMAQHSDILRRRHEGTGQWFLEDPKVTKWLNGSTSNKTLLCTGIPGAGKTVLAAVTVEHLIAKARNSTTGVACLYCSYKSQTEQSVEVLLQAILQQLIQTEVPGITRLVEEIQHHHKARGSRPTSDGLVKSLQAAFAELTSIYIVIDALDECAMEDGTRRQLLAYLAQIRKNADIRLMITSRHVPDVVDEFQNASKIEIRARDEDIRRYLRGQLDRLPKCIQGDAELQQMIQEKVTEATSGMFLLARLYVDSLLDKRTKSKIRSTLQTLSKEAKTIERAYDLAIERLTSQLPEDAALARRILTWIVYAERALTTTELCHALAVEPDNKARLDADNVLDVEDVVSVCAGLVTIDKHSNVIRLVHYTAQEYFESIRETWNPGGQLDLARTCLTYLSFDTFRNGRCSSNDMFEDRLAQHPFFDYASQNWGKHALTVQESLFDLASSVLRDDAVVSSIVQATSVYRVGSHQYSQGYPRITTGLHLMSELGLHVLADEILTKFERTTGQWITQKDNDGRTCLYIAASYGRKSMVELLLGKGADVNADCGRHARALFAAVQSRHKRIVELLIDSGADVKADGPKLMGNVLQTALQNNDREMTMLLLHKGAEADITDQFQRTPLELASRRGWCDVVELIIDQISAVYPMACNDYGMMPLHEACFHGHAEVVKMLLNRGVDASITGKDGWISIHAAAFNGHAEVIQTLLEAGGDPNTMDKRRWTPLMYASYGGHHEAIRVLLRNRAHSHICDTSARSPVHIAAYNGHLQAVNLLTDRVIEIDERDRKGYTPLYDAATQGHADVVRLLLERGADPNIPDNTRWVPIIAASANGHLEVVRALVHHGADLSLTGIDGWGPLTIAADYGHNDIVDLLLPAYSNPQGAPVPSVSSLFSLVEKGRLNALRLFHEQLNIDLHSIDPHGRNLLHAAARHRQLKTFSFLKDIGVEILAIDHKGDDLLCQAASSGSLLLLNTVLDIMPNRSTPNNRSWGPLHWACRTGGKDIIERLIQVGVQSHNVTTLQHEGSWSPTDIAVYHGNSDMLQSLSDSCKTALGPSTRARNVGKHFTNFICDGCEHDLFGARFRCRACTNFDYCFMCKPLLEHLHEGHEWEFTESLISVIEPQSPGKTPLPPQ